MKSCLFMTVLWILRLLFTDATFYFATHPTYINSSINYPPFFSHKVSGTAASVTQQCRRFCTLNSRCRAFNVQILKNRTTLAVFLCRYYESNACNWTTTSLARGLTPSSVLWDKMPTNGMKPKACVDYCAVKFRGDCTRCRGYSELKGLDCDIAPRLCSEYTFAGRAPLPIWPWGFYGPKIDAYCIEQRTLFFGFHIYGSARIGAMGNSSWMWYPFTTSAATMRSHLLSINWSLVSQLVALAGRKQLVVERHYYGLYRYYFNGFNMSPQGHLSLNASLNGSRGFPTLTKAALVYNSTCNRFFWQFVPNVSVCSQRSHFRLNAFQWDAGLNNEGTFFLTFN